MLVLFAISTIWHFFKTRPVKPQLTKADLPTTEFHEEIKKQNVNPIEQWVQEKIADVPFQSREKVLSLPLASAFHEFGLFCEQTNQKNFVAHLTRPQFGTRLGQLKLPGVSSKQTKTGGVVVPMKHFDIAKLRTHFGIVDVSAEEIAAQEKKRKADEALAEDGQRTIEESVPPASQRTAEAYYSGPSKRVRTD